MIQCSRFQVGDSRPHEAKKNVFNPGILEPNFQLEIKLQTVRSPVTLVGPSQSISRSFGNHTSKRGPAPAPAHHALCHNATMWPAIWKDRASRRVVTSRVTESLLLLDSWLITTKNTQKFWPRKKESDTDLWRWRCQSTVYGLDFKETFTVQYSY